MSALFHQLEARLRQAMLTRQVQAVEALRFIKSAILLKTKEAGLEVASDQICCDCLQAQIRLCQETATLYEQQQQPRQAELNLQEVALLKELLPPSLSATELESRLDQILEAYTEDISSRNFKNLLDLAMQTVGLGASRSQVAQLLQQKIKAKSS